MKILPISLFSLLLVMASCSRTKLKRTVKTPDMNLPEWVYAPAKGCSDSELCASGEGINSAESDSYALDSLASIFKVDVNSQLSLSNSSLTDGDKSEVVELYRKNLEKNVSEVLRGATIKKRHQTKDGIFFSLASLSKDKSIKILKSEINQLDSKMKYLLSLKNKLYRKKLYSLYLERDSLNQKLIIVQNKGISPRIKASQIEKLKTQKNTIDTIFMKYSAETPYVIRKQLEELLQDLGYKVSEKKQVDSYILVNSTIKEQYLNVKGFKKFELSLNIQAQDNLGKNLGSFLVKESAVGRNKQDVLVKVRKKILDDIESKITLLNLK